MISLLTELLRSPVGLVSVIISTGLLLGRLPIGKCRLGGSAVFVTGLLFGHCGFILPREIQTIGVVFFVYSVGLRAGPGIVESLKRSKFHFLILAILIVLTSVGLGLLFRRMFGFSPALISGIYAGAMTSSPALAAAMEAVGSSAPSVGYGLAYPLGTLTMVLMVQVLPAVFRANLKKEEALFQQECKKASIERRCFEVTNSNVTHFSIQEVLALGKERFQIARLKRGGKVFTPRPDGQLCLNDIVLAVGSEEALSDLPILLGPLSAETIPESEQARSRWFVVSSRQFVGREIGQMEITYLYGVIVTRIRRGGVEFIPHTNFVLEAGDEIRASGSADDLERLREVVERDTETVYETDIFSFAFGLVLGVLLGLIDVPLNPGFSISLGVAGGPMVVGLILGYIGRFGGVTGHMPKAANLLVGELGLSLFLAAAGSLAGEHFWSVFKENGFVLVLCGFLITMVPIVITVAVARLLLKMNMLVILGTISGGMTSTPALGIITKQTKSDVPALAYTAIYPIAVVLKTMAARILALL